MVVVREVVDIGETTHAIVVLVSQDFGVFADIPLAVVALYLVRGVKDVLLGQKST